MLTSSDHWRGTGLVVGVSGFRRRKQEVPAGMRCTEEDRDMRNRLTERLQSTLLSILATVFAAAPAAATTLADFADVVSMPEPGTLVLLTTGAAALAGLGWLRRRK